MGTLITILAIYAVGYFLSLWAMHNFKDELDINHYDHADDGWDDDWDSNAEAYAALSFGWPFFWFAMSIRLLWRGLLSISKQLENNGSNKTTDGSNLES